MSGYAYHEGYERADVGGGSTMSGSQESATSSAGALDASWRKVMGEMSENPLLLV